MRVVGEVFGTAIVALGVTLGGMGLLLSGGKECAPAFLWTESQENNVKDWLYYASDSIFYSSLIIAGRLFSYLVARLFFSLSSDVPSTADNLYSICFHTYLGYLAVQACLSLYHSVESRWNGQTSQSHSYILLFVLDNTLHMPMQVAKKVTTTKNVTVLGHHILSNLCYVVALYGGHMHFWACLAGISEITNPPLSISFTLKELGCDRGSLKHVYRLALLTVCMSFLAFRIVLFPFWLYLFARDSLYHSTIVVCTSTVFERSIYVSVILVILALSCKWLVPLTIQLLKALNGAEAAEDDAKPRVTATGKRGGFSRAQGASSGAETWLLSMVLMAAVMFLCGQNGWRGALIVPVASALLQIVVMSPICRNMILIYCFSMKLGPAVMRNAVLGFAQCVRPGGRPTNTHCLDMYHFPAWLTASIWVVTALVILPLGPFTCFIRLFYPEHAYGVNSGRYLSLYWLFLREPLAVQGEGPSNGDGLSSLCSSESLIYPITRHNLTPGPSDIDYWVDSSGVGEGKPRLRDMFHDKIFCHRFFTSHGVAHPTLVGYVEGHQLQQFHVDKRRAPHKLIWKPRYSTMGLGVEHFTEWEPAESGAEWAPSHDPYLIEEFVQSTEYDHSEWYRCTTLWAHDEDAPKTGYIWRMRNKKGDKRVQTDIMGGAYCVTSAYTPFIGPTKGGISFDPRTGETQPLDKNVHAALTTGIAQMVKMHTSLGKELYSIGWDVMIVKNVPMFVEFNIGNGFYVADHSVEECHQMAAFFSREFHARLPAQLVQFDPEASSNDHATTVPAAKKTPTRRARSPAAKKKN